MALFNNNAAKPEPTRQSLEQKYNSARRSILMVVIFTVVNLVLLVLNSNSYFVFSAFIPYFLTGLGMILCGRMPMEYYGDEFLEIEFFPPGFLTAMLAISVVIIALYLACWLFSKELRGGWLICAFVVFALDTITMFLLLDDFASYIIDILFHAWVLFDIGKALNVAGRIKNLPAEEAVPAEGDEPSEPTDPQ